jgi:hypothetical protein
MEVVQIGDVTTGKKLGQSLYTTSYLEQKTETQNRYAANRFKNRQCRLEIISAD